MYYNFNYYVSYFKLVCIIIIIIMLFNLFSYKIDFKMIKSRMRVLIERENADVADMAMG
jgi:hypothetical protein